MMRKTLISTFGLLGLLLPLSHASASAKLDALMAQGKWEDALQQALNEKDYVTAGNAILRYQECPSPTRPKPEVWEAKGAAEGVGYLRQAWAQKPKGQEGVETAITFANLLGDNANAMNGNTGAFNVASMGDTLRLARESKTTYEAGLSINPNDPLLAAHYAQFHAKGSLKAGVVIGASKTQAVYWVQRAGKLFNDMPEQNMDQIVRKSFTALRIALAYESLSDRNQIPYFEAAIKLGDRSKSAEGVCSANVARYHLKRPITNY